MSSYYWEKENDTIPTNAVGMNTSILTLIDLQSEDIGNYRCVATNGSGTSKSKYATVTINSKTISYVCSYLANVLYGVATYVHMCLLQS